MEHIGSRIKAFREELGLTQTDLFRSTGIKQTTLSSIETGTEPKAGVIGALLAAYPNLNPDWLLTGSGSMLRDGKGLTPVAKPEPAAVVHPIGNTVQYLPMASQPGADTMLVQALQSALDAATKRAEKAEQESDRWYWLYMQKIIPFLEPEPEQEDQHSDPEPEKSYDQLKKEYVDNCIAAGINPDTGKKWSGFNRSNDGNVAVLRDEATVLDFPTGRRVEDLVIGVDYSDSDAA
ncbi:helix-turn-helix domain-containing protein [Hymenobacter sp. 15J16-1T3B]|uniref:helix-turn-helix domain-containing protein n=1 Tax=Hymenobacter sp. 15J16-1T3B TaxID=2886941 RepID=UPI001D116FA3|nr:helix-turn-helix transcriptional regulator [Hymenobacter sp. 15J16-1T3B]MCC3159726.1 helix-turn-helix domain-containing protein [Hymenobacter sp. 15J16-1T3B]